MKYFLLAFSWIVAILVIHGQIYGAILPVTTLNDNGPGSLREQVANATPGDTIQFAMDGEIRFDSMIVITVDINIQGRGVGNTIFDGQDTTRLFRVDSARIVYFSDVTFTRGNAVYDSYEGGGAILNRGDLTLERTVFRDNTAKFGGAIDNMGFAMNFGPVFITILSSSFVGNEATNKWGPSIGASGEVRLHSGGAINSNAGGGGTSNISATNTTFSGNYASDDGGAIANYSDANSVAPYFECYHCTITDNESPRAGGIDNGRYARTQLENSIVSGNEGLLGIKDVFGAIESIGYSIIGVYQPQNYTPSPGTGDLFGVEAGIGPLGVNGANMPVHSLLCSSPGIDYANPASAPSADQLGNPRLGPPDLGAVERDNDREIRIMNTEGRGQGSLRNAIINACPNDTLDLTVLSGNIIVKEEILLDKNVSIFGNPSFQLSIHGSGPTRIFVIPNGVEAYFNHLTVAYGRPDLYGGGAFQNKGTLRMENCTLFQNAARSGGAIANYGDGADALLEMTNCTLSGNFATATDGGAIDNFSFTHDAVAILKFCTLSQNHAPKRGGGIYSHDQGEISLSNTIVADNTGQEGPDVFGPVQSLGHNLLGDDNMTTGSLVASDITNVNAQLGPLDFHGGGTYVHALLGGSPALDAGDASSAPMTDQRGLPRIVNGSPDIGAFEYDAATFVANLKAETGMTIYPNPNEGHFSIQLPEGIQEELRISLFDMQGRSVWESEFLQGSNPYSVSISHPVPGIYTLAIRGKGTQWVEKIVIK